MSIGTILVRERPRPERIRAWSGAWGLAVATVCFGAFMGQLDASIVTLTYGSLRTRFHTSLAVVEWVSLAYLLALVALLIPAGRLADAYGRKLLYLYGFVVFTVASAACGLAPGIAVLIACRVVQAGGAALMQANSVALVTTSAPPGRTRQALGIQAAAQALGLALGPTIGGVLVSTLGWRWVFVINVPVGIVALVAGHYLLPRTRGHSGRIERFDLAGLVLLSAATTGGLLGVSATSGLSLPGWLTGLLLAASAGLGWAFVRRQRRVAVPLVAPALLRARAVSVGLVGALAGYLLLFGPLVLVPVVLTDRGTSGVTAGLVLTALPAGFGLAATGAERVLPSGLGDRARCLAGAVICLAGVSGLFISPLTASWLAAPLALLGTGLGTFVPGNNALIMKGMPVVRAGTGGGLVNMARGLGTALGVALVTLALHLGGPRAGIAPLAVAAAVLVASALPRAQP